MWVGERVDSVSPGSPVPAEGPVAKATLMAISNVRRGSGDSRGEEATVIQWTVWGRMAENAAQSWPCR